MGHAAACLLAVLSLLHGRSCGGAVSMASMGRNLALFALWPSSGAPPFAAMAASHLRVALDTGLIEELPESEIPADAVAFHTPVQHPGGQAPGRWDTFFLPSSSSWTCEVWSNRPSPLSRASVCTRFRTPGRCGEDLGEFLSISCVITTSWSREHSRTTAGWDVSMCIRGVQDLKSTSAPAFTYPLSFG